MKNGIRRETDPQKLYEKDREILNSKFNRYNKSLADAMQDLNVTRRRYGRRSVEYMEAYMEVEKWKYNIEEVKLTAKFIRPNNAEDMNYRIYQFRTFSARLNAVISDKLDLRFHGTPIYYAEQIIRSGNISSSADRYNGFVKSTNPKGEISATTVRSMNRTVAFYTDLTAYERSLPCGCVFALLPKGKQDEKLKIMDAMGSVNLRRNLEQLFGIFTSPENKARVQKWMQESRLDASKVYTFEEFIDMVQEKSRFLDEGKTRSVRATANSPSGFGGGEVQKIAFGRSTGNLTRLQSSLRGIFSRGKKVSQEINDEGFDRDF